MNTNKGVRNERRLVQWLLDHDWYAQRVGSSGGGGDQALPDIMAMKSDGYGRSISFAIELKSWGSGTGRIPNGEIADLLEVASLSGARPVVVVWPDMRKSEHDGRYFVPVRDMRENKKSYSIRQTELEQAELIEDVFGDSSDVAGSAERDA